MGWLYRIFDKNTRNGVANRIFAIFLGIVAIFVLLFCIAPDFALALLIIVGVAAIMGIIWRVIYDSLL